MSNSPEEQDPELRMLQEAHALVLNKPHQLWTPQDLELLILVVGFAIGLTMRAKDQQTQINNLRSWWSQQQQALLSAQLSLREAKLTLSELQNQLDSVRQTLTARSRTRATSGDATTKKSASSTDPRQTDIFTMFVADDG